MSSGELVNSKFGSYHLSQLISRGGAAEVYRAEHIESRKVVAVKVLLTERATDKLYTNGFETEITILQELRHKGIPSFRRDGHIRDRRCVVMDFCPGTPLHQVAFDEGSSTPINVLGKAMKVVAFVHQNDYIHNDLKLENFIWTPEHQIMLVDFGSAKRASQSQGFLAKWFRGSRTTGTYTYMAPELLRGGMPSPETDVYALGVCAHLLLTGKAPFSGGDRESRVQQALTDRAPPLAAKAPWLDDRLCRILDRCLAKQPTDRPANASVLYHELSALIKHAKEHGTGIIRKRPGTGSYATKGTGRISKNR